MDYKEIKKLMDDMGNSKLDSLEIEFPDGVKISMKKNTNQSNKNVMPSVAQNIATPMVQGQQQVQDMVTTMPAGMPTVQVTTENNLVQVPNSKSSNSDTENYKIIKSPMVGTFYASSSPDKDPFVKVGDKIHKGQVVCIVEAMKLMNEIESEFDGEIVEVCVKDEDIVEYGMPLFRVK